MLGKRSHIALQSSPRKCHNTAFNIAIVFDTPNHMLGTCQASLSALLLICACSAVQVSFDVDLKVNVFEANIRLLGGLLSAHLLASDSTLGLMRMPYAGQLLSLATDLGDRLMEAFEASPTGVVSYVCVHTFAVELHPVVAQPQYLLAGCNSAAVSDNPVLVPHYALEFCSSLMPAEIWVALFLMDTACAGSQTRDICLSYQAWLICSLCTRTVISGGWVFQEQYPTIFRACHSV